MTSHLLLSLLVGASLRLPPASAAGRDCPEEADNRRAIWCEEFDQPGQLSSFWSYDLGFGENGWGNNEQQEYVEENVVVTDDGVLRLHVTRDDNGNYKSSRIKTQNEVAFQYVTMEASIKIPYVAGGLWPAFWLLGQNFEEIGWPKCGEIDVAEWGSADALAKDELQTSVSSAAHWYDDVLEGHTYSSGALTVPTPLDGKFHSYALDWTPESITMYLDDEFVFFKDIRNESEFHDPYFLLLNVAVGGWFTGLENNVDQLTSPGGALEIDYIRAYDNGSGSAIVTCEEMKTCSAASPSMMSTFGGWIFVWSTAVLVLVTLNG